MRGFHACFGALLGAALIIPQLAMFSPAGAAVYSPQQALPEPFIRDFLADPKALLSQYPDGGSKMIERVRDLAASNPATLNPIVGLLARANANQSIAIGTGLGQVAVMAVKTDQAYANQIQEAIASAVSKIRAGDASASTSPPAAPGSSEAKIGSAVKTIDLVEGVTDKGTHAVAAGTEVYENEVVRTGTSGKAELLFADRTNLTVGPVTTIRLDKFVYDPNGGSGDVLVNVTLGSFRFITGVQDPRSYKIATPYAIMGVRGTQFVVNINLHDLTLSVTSGTVSVTTSTGSYTVTAGETLTVSATGVVTGPTPTPPGQGDQFADLGPPTTNLTLADALSAFSAATGQNATGATGGVGGGGGAAGGTVTGFNGTGVGGDSPPGINTFVVNTPGTNFTLTLTAATPAITTTNSVSQSVSPH